MLNSLTISKKHAPNLRLLFYALGGLVGIVVLAVLAFATFQPVKVLPRMRLAPGFSMVRENGERLTSEDLRGQIVLYNFAYTRCRRTLSSSGRPFTGSPSVRQPGCPA